MAKKTVTFDTVREIALRLPGTQEGLTFGKSAVKVNGKLLACVPSHRSAEPNSLALPMDPEDRAALIAAAPHIYYAPDHYLSYPMVLVRLPLVDASALRDLIGMAYKFVIRQGGGSPRRRKRSRPDVMEG